MSIILPFEVGKKINKTKQKIENNCVIDMSYDYCNNLYEQAVIIPNTNNHTFNVNKFENNSYKGN